MPTRGQMGMPYRHSEWLEMQDLRKHVATQEYVEKRDAVSVIAGEKRAMKIDLSLANAELYKGCDIETVAGRANLKTPVADAVGIVGANIEAIMAATQPGDRDEITLTGPMAVWAYLVIFHAVVHLCRKVYYDDGRNGPVLIAAHG